MLAGWGVVYAQEPPDLVLPRVSNAAERLSSGHVAALANNPVVNYKDGHQAAVAALQAAYRASIEEHNNGRAMRFLLVALDPHRDPKYAAALFDLAVICAQVNRLPDTAQFLTESQKYAEPESEVAKAAAGELERVQAIIALVGTDEGKKRLQYDTQLLASVKKDGEEPRAMLDDIKTLTALDSQRWETFALAGVAHAATGSFPLSADDLDTAVAKAERAHSEAAVRLRTAADAARKEASFAEDVSNADQLWEKQQWEEAGKLYSQAWQLSTGHWDAAVEAITAFLQADNIPAAAPILARMRDSAPAPWSARAAAMLEELAAASDDAKSEVARGNTPPARSPAQPLAPAERIRSLVGSVTRPEMELTAKPPHALINDRTPVPPVPDSDLEGGSESGIVSSVSVYEVYRTKLPTIQPPPPVPELENPAPVDPAAPTPPPPPPRRVKMPDTNPPAAPGEPLAVRIETVPAGINVSVDDSSTCISPCNLFLPPGHHTASVSVEGYRVEKRTIEVNPRSPPPSLHIVLERQLGYVVLDYVVLDHAVQGLKVYVDGKLSGTTPAKLQLPVGMHDIGIEVDGKVATQTVKIEEGMQTLHFHP
jgi:hypothetical protein